jgi:hypothetical protein
MSFSVEDTRQKAAPTVKELIRVGTVTLADVKDWLRTIYEIRFFEEKVYDLLGHRAGRRHRLHPPGPRPLRGHRQ